MKRNNLGMAWVMVQVFSILTVFSLFSIFKIDDQDFWTQVWMITAVAIGVGVVGFLVLKLIYRKN